MRTGIRSEHFKDADGNPSGGNTFGAGFSIGWQHGPLGSHDAKCNLSIPNGCVAGCTRKPQNGAFVEDVIEAAADRIRHYQGTKFACNENAMALHSLEQALKYLDARTKAREAKGTEGTYKV